MDKPYYLGLIKVQGSDTTFLHKLVNVSEPRIRMELKPLWNDTRTGTIFDLQGFVSTMISNQETLYGLETDRILLLTWIYKISRRRIK